MAKDMQFILESLHDWQQLVTCILKFVSMDMWELAERYLIFT